MKIAKAIFRIYKKIWLSLRDLMLLLTSQVVCALNIYKGKKTSPSAYLFRFAQRQVCYANVASPPLLKGEALSKITLSEIYTNTKALLVGELAV